MNRKDNLKQLKYSNVTWVTIRTPIYSRTPITSGINSPNARSIAELPSLADPSMKQIFNKSNTLFTDQEINMISTASAPPESNIPLRGSSSKLRQIQIAQQELHPEFALGKSQAKIQIDEIIPISERSDEDLDSVISFEDELEPICFDKEPNDMITSRSRQSNINQFAFQNNEPDDTSKKEMEDHIWDYCHKECNPSIILENKQSREKMVNPYELEFYVDDNSKKTMVKKAKTSLGMKKKVNAIARYSSIEKEKRDFVDKKQQLSKQDQAKLESSISAMRYAKYMQQQNLQMPDFLDGLDFSSAKMKYMKKKSNLTEPASPHGGRYSNVYRHLPRL